MRELETSLQQFGEFILKAQLVKETCLTQPLGDIPLLEGSGAPPIVATLRQQE